MPISTYKNNIKNNLIFFDEVLCKYKKNPYVYKILFSLRVHYCVYPEVFKRQAGINKKQNLWPEEHNKGSYVEAIKKLPGLVFIRRCLGVIKRRLRPAYIKKSLSGNDTIVILGDGIEDRKLATALNVNQLRVVESYSFSFRNILLYKKIRYVLLALRSSGCLKDKSCLIDNAIDAVLLYEQIDLSGIDIIITEDDLSYSNAIVLQKAIEQGIKTVKIEHVLIDATHHDNVLCEYYFYPSTFHKNIREKCAINKHLKYIKGGYLNQDVIAEYKYAPQPSPRIILFITQHGTLYGDKDEIYYIDEILDLIPDEDYVIYIKLHPSAEATGQIGKYSKYKNNSKCRILGGPGKDNYELISGAYFCVSISSALLLEAKLICNRSFFINETDEGWDPFNLGDLCGSIDVIRSKQALKLVLSDCYEFKSEEIFLENYNMTYPETKNKFVEFLDSIQRNKLPGEVKASTTALST